MEQKEKDLLLTDLCARLPYGVKFKWCDNFHIDDYYTLVGINEGLITGRDVNQDDCLFFWGKDEIKPYLRPMSSMTEEEKEEFKNKFKGFFQYFNGSIISDSRIYDRNEAVFVGEESCGELIDWLNKKMFDFRGLIPKDLALSTEIYNPYKD